MNYSYFAPKGAYEFPKPTGSINIPLLRSVKTRNPKPETRNPKLEIRNRHSIGVAILCFGL